MLVFPTKALAQDQLRALRELSTAAFGSEMDSRIAIYDGDTPMSDRCGFGLSLSLERKSRSIVLSQIFQNRGISVHWHISILSFSVVAGMQFVKTCRF